MSKLILAIALMFSQQSLAKVKCQKGVEFDEVVTIVDDNNQDIDLSLNGVGLMKYLFFKVFYAAFYLENNASDAEVIIQSNEYKVGIIHATMNIEKKRLVNLWNDEFKRLCGDENNCKKLQPYHDQFISYARDVKKNERLMLISFSDRFEFEINGNETFEPIRSLEYGKILQMSLFGPEAVNAELKKGILGQKKVCK